MDYGEYKFEPGLKGDVLRLFLTPSLAEIMVEDLRKWLRDRNHSDTDMRVFSIVGKLTPIVS